MLNRALMLCFLATSASAQDASLRYAEFNDLPTARALSAAAWAAVRCAPQPDCDKAQVTQFNYPIIGLTNGHYAIVIHTGDVFQGEHLTLANGKKFDLTAPQIASLATRSGMGTKLGDIIQIAQINSRLTGPQTAAINTYRSGHPSFATNYNLLVSGAIDLQNPLTATVFNELRTAGVLSASEIAVILAPVSTAAIP